MLHESFKGLNPRLVELINSLPVTVYDFMSAIKIDVRVLGSIIHHDPMGFYEKTTDLLAVDHRLPTKYIHTTLLHELIHWTGHKTRLNRRTLYMGQQNKVLLCAEELTAAYGMRMLANHLELPIEDVHIEFTRQRDAYRFIKTQPAIEQAQVAYEYILSLAQAQAKAA